MNVEDVMKHTFERIRNDYVKEYKEKTRDNFVGGVLLGMNIVLSCLKNDLLCMEDNCLENENYIKEFGLDFDIDNEL